MVDGPSGGRSASGWLFGGCALATAALLCVAAIASTTAQPSQVALWLLLAGGPYLVLLSAPLPVGPGLRAAPLLLAAMPGTLMVMGHSALSDDLYRFAWDARVWLSGQSAYGFAPASPALAELRDAAVWARINHPTIPTIYPPLAQVLFVLGYGAGGLVGLKLLGLAAHLILTASIPRVMRTLGSHDQAERAAWLWAVNPLALSESAMAGHYDAWLGLVLLLVALALHRRRMWLVGGLLALGAGLKLVGLFVLPVLARRHPRVALVSGCLCLALAAPLLSAGRGDGSVSGIGHFGQRWQGNAGLFVLLERVTEPLVVLAASDVGGPGNQRIGPDELAFAQLGPLLGWARQQGVDPSGALSVKRATRRAPGVFPRPHAVGLSARALAACLVLSLAFFMGRARAPNVRAVVLALLLLSPQVHPWYLLWLLPLELSRGRRVALIWSLAVLGTYASLDAWQAARVWRESALWMWLEYTLVLTCLAWESRVILRTSLTRIGQRFTLESARTPQ